MAEEMKRKLEEEETVKKKLELERIEKYEEELKVKRMEEERLKKVEEEEKVKRLEELKVKRMEEERLRKVEEEKKEWLKKEEDEKERMKANDLKEKELTSDIVKSLESISQLTSQHLAAKGLLPKDKDKVEVREHTMTYQSSVLKEKSTAKESQRSISHHSDNDDYASLGNTFRDLTEKMKDVMSEMDETQMKFIDEDEDEVKLDQAILEASGLDKEVKVIQIQDQKIQEEEVIKVKTEFTEQI